MRTVEHGRYRQLIARRLLGRIVKGKYAAGDRLRLNDLAEEFQVSITPVREAMLDLTMLGMLDFHPNRGAEARPFGEAELLEVYHIRRVLEAEATRLACCCIPTDVLSLLGAQCQDAISIADLNSAIALDLSLHETIARHCGSRRLQDEISRYSVLMQVIREALGNADHIQERALIEHRNIIRALKAGNPDRAAAAMAQHIQRTGNEVADILWPRLTKGAIRL